MNVSPTKIAFAYKIGKNISISTSMHKHLPIESRKSYHLILFVYHTIPTQIFHIIQYYKDCVYSCLLWFLSFIFFPCIFYIYIPTFILFIFNIVFRILIFIPIYAKYIVMLVHIKLRRDCNFYYYCIAQKKTLFSSATYNKTGKYFIHYFIIIVVKSTEWFNTECSCFPTE